MKKVSFWVRLAFLSVCGLPLVDGNVWATDPTVRYVKGMSGDDDDSIEFSTSAPPKDYDEDSEAQEKKARKAAAKKAKADKKAAENAHKQAVKDHKEIWDSIAHVTRGGKLKYTLENQEDLQKIYVDTLSNIVRGKSEQTIKTEAEKALYKIYQTGGYAAAREAFRERIEKAHSRFARSTYFFSGNPKPYSSRDFAVTSSRFITSGEHMEPGTVEKLRPSVRRLLELNVESGVAVDDKGKKTIITPLQVRMFDKTCEELTKLSKKRINKKQINLEKIISFTETLSEDAKYRVQARIIVGHKDKKEEERIQAFLRLNNKSQPPKAKEVNR